MPAHNHKFVFVCGLHRSGTSPLFKILREHPEISAFQGTSAPEDEGQHLQSVFPAAKEFGGPGNFGFSHEAHMTERSALVTSANRQKLFDEWSRYWDVKRPYLLEKSPPNLIRTRFLQALFPNSYFIVLIRHPIATSLATRKWASSSLPELVRHWLHCHNLFESDRMYLRRVHVLTYENLVASTEKQIAEIYGFLGVAERRPSELNSAGNDRYFHAWRQMAADRNGCSEVRDIVERHEKEAQRYGYSFSRLAEGHAGYEQKDQA